MLFSHIVKRIASILLMGMLLFNWGGYRFLMNYLENKSDSRLEASLDKALYNESDLVSIKVATNLPYYTNSQTFERVNGEITVNGINYKYVKRRLYNDTLELLCIPNISKAGIQNDFSRFANDLAAGNYSSKRSTGNHTHLTKFSVQDFTDDHAFVWQYETNDASFISGMRAITDVPSPHLGRLDKPPQA